MNVCLPYVKLSDLLTEILIFLFGLATNIDLYVFFVSQVCHNFHRLFHCISIFSFLFKGDGNPDDYYVLYERA